MATNVNWNGVSYSIPSSGETNWPNLSNFFIALGNNAAVAAQAKQAIRIATSSPITVAAASDYTVVSKLTVPATVAVNLPAGVNGQIFVILDGTGDAASNNITITPNGAETINGAATLVLNHNRQSVTLQYSSAVTDWKVLENVIYPGTISLTSDVTGILPPANGGTGVANNAASTLAISGNFATTLTVTGATGVTLPTTGTLATLAGAESLSNKTLPNPIVTGQLLLQNPSGSQPTLALSEDPDNGTNKVVLQAPATLASDYTLTFPADDGDSGECLTTNGSGVLTWEPVVTNPMTTRGDMIRGGVGGAPERFAAVTDNRVVRGDGTDVVLGQIDDPAFFSSGAYADGTNAGILPPVSSMSDALATQLGFKRYQHGTTYNGGNAPTITLTGGGGSLSSVQQGDFIPYQDQAGNWHCRFNIDLTLDSQTRTFVDIAVNGLTILAGGFGQAITGFPSTALSLQYAVFRTAVGGIEIAHASGTTTIYTMSGDVRLNAKPNWAY